MASTERLLNDVPNTASTVVRPTVCRVVFAGHGVPKTQRRAALSLLDSLFVRVCVSTFIVQGLTIYLALLYCFWKLGLPGAALELEPVVLVDGQRYTAVQYLGFNLLLGQINEAMCMVPWRILYNIMGQIFYRTIFWVK